MVGIYIIENKTKSKLYIGSAINVNKQITTIRKNLKTNNFHIESLQADFNNNDKFEFSYIKCKNSELNSQKYKLIHQCNTSNPKFGYNRSLPKDWCKLIENGYLQSPVDIDLNDKINLKEYESIPISIDSITSCQDVSTEYNELITKYNELESNFIKIKKERDTFHNFITSLKAWEIGEYI